MSEPTYSYVKGQGWVLDNRVVYDKDGVAFYANLVDLPNVGDAWFMVKEGDGLINGELDMNMVIKHVKMFSFVISDVYKGMSAFDHAFYRSFHRRFVVLEPV